MRSALSIVFVGLSGLALVACGSSGPDGPRGGGGTGGVVTLDCTTLTNPPPDCQKACTSDSQCEASFCSNGSCVALCTPEPAEGCGENSTCNSRGRCVPNIGTGGTGGSGNTGGSGCQSIQVTPTRSIPNVMFLVDQSGSMRWSLDDDAEPLPGSSDPDRWEAAHTAITQIISELEPIVRFGLTTYESENGGATPAECPILGPTAGGAIGFFDVNESSDPINANYPASFPGGEDTPTGDAIDVLVDWIEQPPNTPPADGPTIIVLATDGEPDSCEVPDPNPTAGARLEAVNAAANAHAPPPAGAGIDVFVLWVGILNNTATEMHLQDVANAGVDGTGTVWVGENPETLETAFRQIIKDSISCEIEISKPFNAETIDQACNEGDVRLNGTPLDCPSDWRIKDEPPYNTIELLGSACDTLKGGEVTFTAEFPCGTIVVE